jgi:hypothetical protein
MGRSMNSVRTMSFDEGNGIVLEANMEADRR